MKSSSLLFVLFAAVLLAGLFLFFKPKTKSQTTSPTTQTVSATPAQKIKTVELIFKNKQLVSGEIIIRVHEGDKVVIKATSDEPEELHIHGINKFVDLEKDKQATLSFTADVTGRFPFELEHSGIDIGAIEVEPK